jgi:LPS export ABC transporter protein LptC
MPMSPRRIAKALAVLGTVALTAVVIVTVWVVRHRESAEKLSNAADITPGTLLHARNFHWSQMRGSQLDWVLKAKDASYSTDRTSIILKDAELSMVAKDGKHLLLAAPAVSLTMKGNHISRAKLSGGLRVNYGDFTLTTDDAVFQPDTDQLDAPGPIKIEGQGFTVTGVGLTGHPKTEVFELLNQVRTEIKPKPKGAQPNVS